MSRQLKLIAAVAVVLVALSGFSPGRRGSSHHHSGGGGCSSSNSSSHNSSSSYDDDDDSGSSYDKGYNDGYRRGNRYDTTPNPTRSSTGGSSTPTGTIEECAAQGGGRPVAVVSVQNPNGGRKTYTVKVDFRDATGGVVDSGSATAGVSGNGTESVDVRMEHPDRVGQVDECVVVSVS